MKTLSSFVYKHMVKALGKVIGKLPPYRCAAPLQAEEGAALTFIAWGDPQISALSPLRAGRVYGAVRDLKHAASAFDALLLLGDLTEYGLQCEYRMMAELLAPAADKLRTVLAVSGNHDVRLRRWKKQLARFNAFRQSLGAKPSEGSYFQQQEINGYPFILMGADKTKFEASYISDTQLALLDNALTQADSNKPVFVLNHQPLRDTCGLPLTWLGKGSWRGTVGAQSDRLRAVFEKHRNVIYITGHLHYSTGIYTYADYGAFKTVSVPTVGVINHGDFDAPSQGLVFSVLEDKIVVRSRLFGNGAYADGSIPNARFEIPIEKTE